MAATAPTRIRYIPALDGLRAVSVLAVMLYHAGVSWMPGGFLGVDLFFVLSGYLITTLLLVERRDTGRVDLKAFWIRRARRLLPALLLVLIAVAGYATWAADPASLRSIRWDGLASLGYVANWRFVFSEQSYFESFAAPSPLRHMWSLAVEEQWYLFWPLFFSGVVAWCKGRIELVLAIVTTLAALSALLMASMFVEGGDPSRAYYGTDTRAQTLLIGAALAFALHRWPVTSRPARLGVQLAGVVGSLVIVAMFLSVHDDDAWLYNGGFVVLSLAGIGVIAAAVAPRAGFVQRVLRPAPMQWVGRISYGLYLWHWPIDVYVTPSRFGLTGFGLFAVRTALTFSVALLSFHLVEVPVREGRLRRLRPVRPIWITASSGAAVAILLVVATAGGGLSAEAAGSRGTKGGQREGREEITITTVPTSAAVEGQVANPETPPPVPPGEEVESVIVGDSVGWTLGWTAPEVEGLEIGNRGVLGCGVVPGDPYVGKRRLDTFECGNWTEPWRNAAAQQPDVVLISAGAWEIYDHENEGERLKVFTDEYRQFLLDSFQQGIDIIADQSDARIGLLTVPCYQERDDNYGGRDGERNDPKRNKWVNDVLAEVAERNAGRVALIDIGSFICPDGKPIERIDGVLLREDGVHYTEEAVPLVWEWLAPQVIDLARRPVL